MGFSFHFTLLVHGSFNWLYEQQNPCQILQYVKYFDFIAPQD